MKQNAQNVGIYQNFQLAVSYAYAVYRAGYQSQEIAPAFLFSVGVKRQNSHKIAEVVFTYFHGSVRVVDELNRRVKPYYAAQARQIESYIAQKLSHAQIGYGNLGYRAVYEFQSGYLLAQLRNHIGIAVGGVHLRVQKQRIGIALIVHRQERIGIEFIAVFIQKIQIYRKFHTGKTQKIDACVQFVPYSQFASRLYTQSQEQVFDKRADDRGDVYFGIRRRTYRDFAGNNRPVFERARHRKIRGTQRFRFARDVSVGVDTYRLHIELGLNEVTQSRIVASILVFRAYRCAERKVVGDVERERNRIEYMVEIQRKFYALNPQLRARNEHSDHGIYRVFIQMQREYRAFVRRESKVFEAACAVLRDQKSDKRHYIEPAAFSFVAVGVKRTRSRSRIRIIRVQIRHKPAEQPRNFRSTRQNLSYIQVRQPQLRHKLFPAAFKVGRIYIKRTQNDGATLRQRQIRG